MTYPGLAWNFWIFMKKKKRYSYGQDYYYSFFFYMDILKNMRGCDLRPTLVLDGYIPIATLLQHIFWDSQYILSSTDTFLTAKSDLCICFQSREYCLVSHDCFKPNQKQQNETRAMYRTMKWKESFWLTSRISSIKEKGKSYTIKQFRRN